MEKDPINESQNGYEAIITKQPLVGEAKDLTDNERNLPVGLTQLLKARTVTISQLIDPVEVSDCYARQIMGAARNFGLKFTDTDNIDVIRVVRPQTCSRGCCGICCVLPSLEVQSPPGTTVAMIKERRSCCCPVYEIIDTNEDVIFTFSPACTYYSLVNLCCLDIEINITDMNGQLAAKLCKQTRGRCGECSGAANDFSITYLQDMPVMQKASVLGSVFLVDFHYFERQNRCCC